LPALIKCTEMRDEIYPGRGFKYYSASSIHPQISTDFKI
jgi:hypothetical protein